MGEIDLVMEEDDVVVFVEVRYRNTARFGGPAETVDRRKQRKLRATAQYYLQTHRRLVNRPCRFDVVAILPGDGESGIQWIPDAFYGA